MTGKTHQIAGITAGLGWFLTQAPPAYGPATLAAVLVGSSIGALLPDIDQPAAEIWDKIPIVGHTAGKITSKAAFGHRNLTHSILGFVLIGLLTHRIVFKFPDYWGIDKMILFVAVMISYGVHLLADAFTVEGIPLLFPWQRNFGLPPKPLEGIRIQSGKWFENLIIFPAVNIVLIVLIITYWNSIKAILFKLGRSGWMLPKAAFKEATWAMD